MGEDTVPLVVADFHQSKASQEKCSLYCEKGLPHNGRVADLSAYPLSRGNKTDDGTLERGQPAHRGIHAARTSTVPVASGIRREHFHNAVIQQLRLSLLPT